MIPLWVISLLGTSGAGEFLYSDGCTVSIKGRMTVNEWVVDVYVNAIPHFAWGCNGFHTGMTGSFKSVVGYYLALVLNQLSEYGAEGRKELLSIMKDYLE